MTNFKRACFLALAILSITFASSLYASCFCRGNFCLQDTNPNLSCPKASGCGIGCSGPPPVEYNQIDNVETEQAHSAMDSLQAVTKKQ